MISHIIIYYGVLTVTLNIIKKGTEFATTDHCGAIKILDNRIDSEYLLYELRLKSDLLGFDRALRASLENMKKVTVNIPIDEKGEFDSKTQREVADRYKEIEKLKNILHDISDEIKYSEVTMNNIGETKEVRLGDERLFSIDNGKRIRKQDINKAKGKIPVYSASKYKSEYLGFVSDKIKEIVPKAKKFNGKYLTVNADGSVGKVFLREGEFYVNDIVNAIKILDGNILEEYVLFELERILYLQGYSSWSNKLYKEKLRNIYIEIPLDAEGNFDTEKQKEIADKLMYVNELKNEIIEEINSLINTTIIVE